MAFERIGAAQPTEVEAQGNGHPADELARVREQIKALQEREGALKAELQALPEAERVGRHYACQITVRDVRRLNQSALLEAATAALGEEAVEACYGTSQTTVVAVKPL